MLLIVDIRDEDPGTHIGLYYGHLPEYIDEVPSDRQEMMLKRLQGVIHDEINTIQEELRASGEVDKVTYMRRDPSTEP